VEAPRGRRSGVVVRPWRWSLGARRASGASRREEEPKAAAGGVGLGGSAPRLRACVIIEWAESGRVV